MRTSFSGILDFFSKKQGYSLIPPQESQSDDINQKFFESSEKKFNQLRSSIFTQFRYDYPESNYSQGAYSVLLKLCQTSKILHSQLKKENKIIYLAAALVGDKAVLTDLKHSAIEEMTLFQHEIQIIEECVPILQTTKDNFHTLFNTECSLKEYAARCEFYRMLNSLTPVLESLQKRILLAAAWTGNKEVLKNLSDKINGSLETFFTEEEVVSLEKLLPQIALEHSMCTMKFESRLLYRLSKEKNLLSLVILYGNPVFVKTMIDLGVNVNTPIARSGFTGRWLATIIITPLMSAVLQYERSLKSMRSSEEISVDLDSCFEIIKLLFEAGASVKKDSGLPNQAKVDEQTASPSVEIEDYCKSQNLKALTQLFQSKNNLDSGINTEDLKSGSDQVANFSFI